MAHAGRQGTMPGTRAVRATRAQNMRRGLLELFTGTSIIERARVQEIRKTPRLELPPQEFSSTSIILPHLLRTATAPATLSSPSSAVSLNNTFPAHSITANSSRDIQRTMSLPVPATRSTSRPFIGVDPEEQYLADLAARGRRRQSKRARGARSRRCCVINFKDRKVRSKLIACCLSAIFLMIVLTICKFAVIYHIRMS